MAPVCKKLKCENSFDTIVCVTAQHREMMDQVLQVYDLKPDIDRNIMKKDQLLLSPVELWLNRLQGLGILHDLLLP